MIFIMGFTLASKECKPDGVHLATCSSPSWLHIEKNGRRVRKVKCLRLNPLGSSKNDEYLQDNFLTEVRPDVGDVFLAYTDGVMDGYESENQFRKGIKSKPIQMDQADIFAEINTRAQEAGSGYVLADDFTLLMLRRTGTQH